MSRRSIVGARRVLAAALLGLSVPGCRDATTAPAAAARPALSQGVAGTLLSCPTNAEERAAAWIGPEGGSVQARGATLRVPAGAVADSTHFEIVVPVSQTMKVDVHAAGAAHFRFLTPASITINFSRCAGSSVPVALLQAAYIDLNTEAVLEFMGGSVDATGRKVTFTTPHLSGYAIVY
jgi:hypothetical protein